MKKFIIKLFIYLTPVLTLLAIYLYQDPFKVIYHYNTYFHSNDSFYFDVPGDVITTQILIQKHDKYNYDSYIFGSSRAGHYSIGEWETHIGPHNCFHFNVNYESLYGIEKKMEFIERNNYELKNALIIIDDELLSVVTNGSGHLRIKHPALSGQNRLDFQMEFLADYFDKDFLPAYLDLIFRGYDKLSKTHRDQFTKVLFNYDTITNEVSVPRQEARLNKDSTTVFVPANPIFYKRDTLQHSGAAVIGLRQQEMLQNIKKILDQKHTNYKIVISPLYKQLKLNEADLDILYRIMGKEHVYDFSGINAITNNLSNYYEVSHYRPRVCKIIMDSIYKQ